jgi:DNA-binding transcriptional LysR family regulator
MRSAQGVTAVEFKQLEMFVALADERHVQRAAERVFRTQPAVSMAIAKLEDEIGSRLFVRSENFRLTPAGDILYSYARQLLALREEVTAALLARVRYSGGCGERALPGRSDPRRRS